ncbi:Uma2 family endonuclease [Euhalothece natronophila Z-M001]|uniref:Uma2 family endonuclease n=1 Tax=Euhalothece natronophila Z-M001 TaxID=522448 RepID=A0A5B8NR25_9CHRO|nr:Uma2 family endonuclease [Euhalothece natronophila]QDZ41427.1 Uma2 family endonuclease [Euhalothece natronophila Z-M001]
MYQTNPPRSPKEILPTMYDLKSEDPEELGGSDQFHIYQPRLLEETFRPANYPLDKVFTGTDLNLYYDPCHTQWYKRPDWFAVVGVSWLYEEKDLRLSYVIWQEGVDPLIVVELLSPGTEKEDLGQTLREVNQPPTKWEVYEQVLRVPYYVIFNRYTNELQVFTLQAERYQPVDITNSPLWIPSIELGLGLWQGRYEGIERLWLHWFDEEGNWIPTTVEREEQKRKQLNEEQRRVATLQAELARYQNTFGKLPESGGSAE